ncbi:MAG: hypothetical protein E3J71_02380 [Candidatus Stahlbacteria bacterium]|nr:MAG: hypothetical protein E3J71_02380 [Candidatus Stahlbacteria bacterium]
MSTRTVEVIRVGTIDLDINYPGKQLVRLRDLSALYEGGSVKDLKELHDRLRGKRLSAINVEVWDQISGAYLGSYNTDEHGTLVLPTDKKFVEVLQWKLAGGGYSDCFNGERAAGMPGLFFYFPCNEYRGKIIKSFPGVSGQQVDMSEMDTPWQWYGSGFYNRPALKVTDEGGIVSPLTMYGATTQGYCSFQFLWYCSDHTVNRKIFSYGAMRGEIGNYFATLEVYDDKLKGIIGNGESVGNTQLASGKWYVLHVETAMGGGSVYNIEQHIYEPVVIGYMTVWLGDGEVKEFDVSGSIEGSFGDAEPIVAFSGMAEDGFDELRNLERELYESEISGYAKFLKNGRIQGKSKGELGDVGW